MSSILKLLGLGLLEGLRNVNDICFHVVYSGAKCGRRSTLCNCCSCFVGMDFAAILVPLLPPFFILQRFVSMFVPESQSCYDNIIL